MSVEGFDLESPSAIGAAIGALVTAGGWLVRMLTSNQKEHRDKIAALEVELAKNYVPREEIESRFDRLTESFEKRFDHLQASIDKVLDHLHAK